MKWDPINRDGQDPWGGYSRMSITASSTTGLSPLYAEEEQKRRSDRLQLNKEDDYYKALRALRHATGNAPSIMQTLENTAFDVVGNSPREAVGNLIVGTLGSAGLGLAKKVLAKTIYGAPEWTPSLAETMYSKGRTLVNKLSVGEDALTEKILERNPRYSALSQRIESFRERPVNNITNSEYSRYVDWVTERDRLQAQLTGGTRNLFGTLDRGITNKMRKFEEKIPNEIPNEPRFNELDLAYRDELDELPNFHEVAGTTRESFSTNAEIRPRGIVDELLEERLREAENIGVPSRNPTPKDFMETLNIRVGDPAYSGKLFPLVKDIVEEKAPGLSVHGYLPVASEKIPTLQRGKMIQEQISAALDDALMGAKRYGIYDGTESLSRVSATYPMRTYLRLIEEGKLTPEQTVTHIAGTVPMNDLASRTVLSQQYRERTAKLLEMLKKRSTVTMNPELEGKSLDEILRGDQRLQVFFGRLFGTGIGVGLGQKYLEPQPTY